MSPHEKRKSMADALRSTLIRLVQGSVPEGALRSNEVEALVGLCMMGVSAIGDEDPKAMLSEVTDPVLEHLVCRMPELQSHDAMRPVSQFLMFEWCFRNGFLNDDWRWEWTGKSTGQAHISPRIPLSQVPLPSKPTVRSTPSGTG